MRTKALVLGAIALAVSLFTAQAQSNVYSANVVGYVNIVIEGGGYYNLLANPLNNTSGGNGLTNLFVTGPGDFDQVLTWDTLNFDFDAVQPYYGSGAWDQSIDLPVGKAFFYANNNSTFTNTFVGEVVQGVAFTNNLLGGGYYNMVGASVPMGGSFTNAIAETTPGDFDQVLRWDTPNFDFDPNQPSYGGGVWSDTSLQIAVGEGFFYVNNNADMEWVRNFTVQ